VTLLGVGVGAAPSAGDTDAWRLPAEGECAAAVRAPEAGDALPFPFKPGDVLDAQKAASLQSFLPEELWANRERFFYDGMQLEIGPCFRDYSPPAFFAEATERFRGQATLAPDGKLGGHTAGVPFPPDTIDPNDPQAALRWAWNWVSRYRAGGSFGEVRISLLARDLEQRFEATYFWVPLAGRAERAADGYRLPAPYEFAWASGGESKNLSTGDECKFRQYATGGRHPDFFVWNSAARKVERAIAYDSEAPLTACLIGASIGGGLFLHGASPQLHEWKLVGVRDLLAPINARVPSFPEDEKRGFGPMGVSYASDRWELRRTVVIEGRFREGAFGDGVTRFRWYLDLQTLFPLYYAAYRESGAQGGLGYFVGRWSEDREGYPRWPDDPARPVRVLDTVGEALVDWNDQDVVRAESWSAVSIPKDEKKLLRSLSQSSLRGR
jgi:hypothetical protein